jgi:hypothetical protein
MHELLPERIPASTPVLSDVNMMKARLDEIDRQIGALNVEKLRLSHHFQYELKKIAVANTPVEGTKQMSSSWEHQHGEYIDGFEGSCPENNKNA